MGLVIFNIQVAALFLKPLHHSKSPPWSILGNCQSKELVRESPAKSDRGVHGEGAQKRTSWVNEYSFILKILRGELPGSYWSTAWCSRAKLQTKAATCSGGAQCRQTERISPLKSQRFTAKPFKILPYPGMTLGVLKPKLLFLKRLLLL